jgi:Beta-ketoacyl synthase, N-terminal domain
MRLYVNGIGMLGPGLSGWTESRAVLAGEREYFQVAPPEPSASVLPPNERRRSSAIVRWAVQVAQEAIRQAGADATELATVFASSGGDSDVLDRLCTALATPQRVISPTLFHHSVHNAAAGYWGIATGSQQSSTALSCYDSSFCAGLLEAAATASLEERDVLLVAYDLPPPHPLHAALPLPAGFAAAFVLTRIPAKYNLAGLDLNLSQDRSGEATPMDDEQMEFLRKGNPAARSLPLLAAIAKHHAGRLRLEYLEDQNLLIGVTPCPS